MDFMLHRCLKRNLSGAVSVPRLVSVCILGLFLIFSSVSDGSPEPGHITGKVTVFQKKIFGKLKKKKDMSGVLVYIIGFKSEAPRVIPDLVQQNRSFYPDILPIVAGQKVRFPNKDDIYHNVFSISHTKSFDLGQYKMTEPPKTVLFEKPGLVPVFCNIHPQMISYVLVLENKAYAMTDKDGSFRIQDVPPGAYTANAWLPNAKRVSQDILIKAGQGININLEINEILKKKPHTRKDGSAYPLVKNKAENLYED